MFCTRYVLMLFIDSYTSLLSDSSELIKVCLLSDLMSCFNTLDPSNQTGHRETEMSTFSQGFHGAHGLLLKSSSAHQMLCVAAELF